MFLPSVPRDRESAVGEYAQLLTVLQFTAVFFVKCLVKLIAAVTDDIAVCIVYDLIFTERVYCLYGMYRSNGIAAGFDGITLGS